MLSVYIELSGDSKAISGRLLFLFFIVLFFFFTLPPNFFSLCPITGGLNVVINCNLRISDRLLICFIIKGITSQDFLLFVWVLTGNVSDSCCVCFSGSIMPVPL